MRIGKRIWLSPNEPGGFSQRALQSSAEAAPVQAKQKLLVKDLRILLVDNDEDTRKTLSYLLDSTGIKNIQTAVSGEEALKIFKPEDFDLVITDYSMGLGMNGVNFAQEIKSQSLLTPVILMSNYVSKETEESARKVTDVIIGKGEALKLVNWLKTYCSQSSVSETKNPDPEIITSGEVTMYDTVDERTSGIALPESSPASPLNEAPSQN